MGSHYDGVLLLAEILGGVVQLSLDRASVAFAVNEADGQRNALLPCKSFESRSLLVHEVNTRDCDEVKSGIFNDVIQQFP
jgi:hypothetical protein